MACYKAYAPRHHTDADDHRRSDDERYDHPGQVSCAGNCLLDQGNIIISLSDVVDSQDIKRDTDHL